jgi:Zn-dependent protease
MSDVVNWPPTWATLLLVPALLLGFTVHEVAHAVVAYLLGDTSQVERQRLSFNPIRHISWGGMLAFLLLGFGWAKPVWMDPTRFRVRNRAFGVFLVSVAGASANLLVAAAVALAIAISMLIVAVGTGAEMGDVGQFFLVEDPGPDLQGIAVAFSSTVVQVNLMLAFINLLPIPSLDGYHALNGLIRAIRDALQGRKREEAWPQSAAQEAMGSAPPPSPASIHFDIALDYQQAGQLDEAIVRYRQAIANDEHFDLAYYNLGLAYWAKGRLSLASSAFRAAMQASRDVHVRIQSDLRIRELDQAQADPVVELRPAPAPLQSTEGSAAVEEQPSSIDPVVARQVWLRFIAGALMLLALGVGTWVFVTVAALASLG